ncbi:MAG: hypothetical protein ACMXYC_01215 [Candidatus Woesearchaeota archaeon]
MAGFCQWESLPQQFHQHITDMLVQNPQTYTYKPFTHYAHGYLNWDTHTQQTNPMIPNNGWHWLQGNNTVQGELFGGCIDVLEFMKSTIYWPKPTFWKGKILFFETSEDKPSPAQVKYMLRNYATQGVFNQIAGLLFGRPRNYTPQENKELDDAIIQIVQGEANNHTLPIVTNMDFGHTDPQWILPLGIKAQLDCTKKEFTLLEAMYQNH